MTASTEEVPSFSPSVRVQLEEVLRHAEPTWQRGHDNAAILNQHIHGAPPSLFQSVRDHLRLNGIDLATAGIRNIREVMASPDDYLVSVFLVAAYRLLIHLESTEFHGALGVSSEDFRIFLNSCLAKNGVGFELHPSGWRKSVQTDVEAIYRALVTGDDDVAHFKQGDVQIEMVASTVQSKLDGQGTVIIDYGVGLGRFLTGIGAAERFKNSTYIGVDEPISNGAKEAARPFAGSVRFMPRAGYLASPPAADVVVVMNTLHHIPFSDLAHQFNAMLNSLKPNGLLLLHEMGAHRSPERRNVPWRTEHILKLFTSMQLDTNTRSTLSRSGVPLTNAIIRVKAPGNLEATLSANAKQVWDAMKNQTLDDISRLYDSGAADDHLELHRNIIYNANLDLNRP